MGAQNFEVLGNMEQVRWQNQSRRWSTCRRLVSIPYTHVHCMCYISLRYIILGSAQAGQVWICPASVPGITAGVARIGKHVLRRRSPSSDHFFYGTRTRPRFCKIIFFSHVIWLVLVLVLVQICGLCPQKRGTRYPRPEFLGVGWTKSGQGNTRRNVRISLKNKNRF